VFDNYKQTVDFFNSIISLLPAELAKKYSEQMLMLQTVYSDVSTAKDAFNTVTQQLYNALLANLKAQGFIEKRRVKA
jgi:hypothetical protein